MSNECLVKCYIFWDSLTKGRTDGALRGLVAPVTDAPDVPASEEHLIEFLAKAYPSLYYYLPQADVVPATPSMADMLVPAPATP